MRKAMDDLNIKVQAVSAELYKNASAQQQSAGADATGPQAEPQSPPDDAKKSDVVDADFEVVDKNKK